MESVAAVTPANQAIVEAMSRAWGNFPTVEFDRSNPAFKSQYATINGIVATIRPMLTAEGLWISQPIVEQGENTAAVETILWHKSGQSMSFGISAVPVDKKNAQGYGSGLTYARRYGLCAALCITTGEDDDDGNAAAAAKPAPKPQPAKQEAKAAPAEGVIGPERGTKLLTYAALRGVEIHHLRDWLKNEIAGADTRVDGNPANWPAAWGKPATDWLKTLPIVPPPEQEGDDRNPY